MMARTLSLFSRRLLLALVAAGTATVALSQEQLLTTSSEARALFQQLNQRYIRENVDRLTEIDQAYSDALTALSAENSARLNAFLDQQRADIDELRGLGLDTAERDRRMQQIQDRLATQRQSQFDYFIAEQDRLSDLHEQQRDAQRALQAALVEGLQSEQRTVIANLVNGPVSTDAILDAMAEIRTNAIVQQESAGNVAAPVDFGAGAGAGTQAALPAAGIEPPAAASMQDCPRSAPMDRQRTSVLPNNRLLEIDVAGDPLRLLFHWDELPGSDVAPRDGLPDIVQTMVDQIDTTLEAFAAAGFRKIQGVRVCETDRVFQVFAYPVVGNNAPGGTANERSFDLRFIPGQDPQQLLDNTRNTLIHELFHSIQFSYAIHDAPDWLIEGSAKLAPDLFDAEIDASRFDLPSERTASLDTCERQLLDSPRRNIVRRSSLFQDTTNACQSKLFWRYFTEQLGRSTNEPARGVDALADLFAQMEDSPSGWRIQDSDRIIGAGDFDGEGREEILLQSATHIGLISSAYDENRVVNVTAAGQRLGAAGWTLNPRDEFLAVGNFNGDARADVLVRSRTHVGFLGLDQNNAFRTLGSVAFDSGRFGDGWRPFAADELLAIADLNGDGRDEVILRSSGYLGAVGLSRTNAPESIAVTPRSALFDGRRALNDDAEIAGVADMNGDGREELIARDSLGVFVIALDLADRFILVDAVANGERFGTDWLLAAGNQIRGAGNLDGDSDGRDEFVIQNGALVGFIGLDEKTSRLITRRIVRLDGTEPAEYAVVAVDSVDSEPDAELIVLQADALLVFKLSDELEPEQIGAWQPGDREADDDSVLTDVVRQIGAFDRQPFEVALLAAMNEPGVRNIMVRSASDYRVFGYHERAGLVYETWIGFDRYFYDFMSHLDRLIRARTSGARNLATFWRDFSITLNIKNLDASTLPREHVLIDEQNDGFVYTATQGSAKWPVVHRGSARGESLDSGNDPVTAERWSSNHFYVSPFESNSQVVTVNLRPEPGAGPVSANVAIFEGDRLVAMHKDANPRGGLMLREFLLAPGQELRLIVANAYDSANYAVRLTRVKR